MTILISRRFLPVAGTVVMAAASWMIHLTNALGDVQNTQARGEYLFESHDELREDVRQQTKDISEIHRMLARIEAMLK